MTSFTQQGLLNDKRTQYAVIALIIVGLAAAGWFGYSWYKRNKEQAAYKDLAEAIDGYVKVRTTSPTPEKWADVDRAFNAGAESHSSSALYPFFLTYRADALIEQGKQKDALALMEKALTYFSKSQPVYYLYALKTALMKTDSADPAVQKQGRDELEALSKDAANPIKEVAAERLNPESAASKLSPNGLSF